MNCRVQFYSFLSLKIPTCYSFLFQTHLNNLFIHITLTHVVINILKAASTTWRRFLWHFAGQPDYKTVSEDDIIIGHNKEFKLIRALSKEEREQKIANYTKFFVQRHPLERLVSTYFSKFTDKGKRVYYKNTIGKPAANKYMPQLVHGVKIRF